MNPYQIAGPLKDPVVFLKIEHKERRRILCILNVCLWLYHLVAGIQDREGFSL